jgi:predicted phosphodiesterase
MPETTTKTKSDLVREVCAEMPDLSSHKLAMVCLKRWPGVFLTMEKARWVVRDVRGLAGNESRRESKPKSFLKAPGWQQNVQPKTRSKKRLPLVITGPARVAVFGDLHIPYHSPEAVEVMVGYLKKARPDIILINGDLCDFYSCSRHEKDPRRPIVEEIEATRQFLWWLRKQFPKTRIIYKIGNHETNLERYLMRAAPVLLGVTDFEIGAIMRLDDMKIELVSSLQLVQAGRLPIYHGHELPQGMTSPVNPARGIWMRVQETMLCNHWHRTSDHTETTGVSKKVSSCWSLGCLCDLSPDYAIVNKWNHGFAIVSIINKAGDFEVSNHRIIDGKVY